MSNPTARQRDSSPGRARLSAVKWPVPSTEPDTSAVDDSWLGEERPRHSFIAYKPDAARAREARPSIAPAPPLAYDVWDSPHALLVLVDLPGVEARHFSLSLGSQALYLEVSVPAGDEPRFGAPTGKHEVRLEVPAGAGPDSIDAALRHGVLRIRISKESSGLRRVPIFAGDDSDSDRDY
jgi:HSP20 family molecular chaperone IbpA